MWRSQHLCVAMGILVLGLVGVAVLVPVGDGIDMLGMLQPFSWYLHWFQANIHCLARYWHLVIPMCPLCMACSISSLSKGGMMRASPLRMSPSSTVMPRCDGCGKGIVLWVCPWYPQAILPLLCQQGCAGVGHLGLSSGTPVSSLGWCGHGVWLCQVLLLDQSVVSTLTGHQQLASPFQVSTWWWHHSSAVWAASVEIELECQQGFSGWSAPGVCGHYGECMAKDIRVKSFSSKDTG